MSIYYDSYVMLETKKKSFRYKASLNLKIGIARINMSIDFNISAAISHTNTNFALLYYADSEKARYIELLCFVKEQFLLKF